MSASVSTPLPGSPSDAPAIAFDIDGVFKAGRFFFPEGLRALATAKRAGCPVAFVTNGGAGLGEAEYLEALKLKIIAAAPEEDRAEFAGCLDSVVLDSMILSYTPMGADPAFKAQKLLLVGDPRDKILALAEAYGWTSVVHCSDYVAANPAVDPFAQARGGSHAAVASPPAPRPASGSLGDCNGATVAHAHAAAMAVEGGGDNFDAVVVMTDPHNWFEALQVAVDVVASAAPNSTEAMEFDTGRHVKVHFSNPDIFWKAAHPQPRFGQGAFRLAFETLLRARLSLLKAPPALIDMALRSTVVQWGKPALPTLRCAERRLDAMRLAADGMDATTAASTHGYWMVGDNPASDMALAALGGEAWKGVLVKTGVYVETDATCGAAGAEEGVAQAVDFILKSAKAASLQSALASDLAAEAAVGGQVCDPCKEANSKTSAK